MKNNQQKFAYSNSLGSARSIVLGSYLRDAIQYQFSKTEKRKSDNKGLPYKADALKKQHTFIDEKAHKPLLIDMKRHIE